MTGPADMRIRLRLPVTPLGRALWAVVAAGLAMLIVSALLLLDNTYSVLRPDPRVPHTVWAGYTPDISLVLKPALAAPAMEGVTVRGVPAAWLLQAAAPYEASVIAHPNAAAERYDVALALNTQRLGPLILKELEKLALPQALGPFLLEHPGFQRLRPGILALNASAALENETVAALADSARESVQAFDYPAEGDHFAVLTIDNRNGCVPAFAAVMIRAGLLPLEAAGIHEQDFAAFLSKFAALTVLADPVSDDILRVSVRMRFNEFATMADVECYATILSFTRHFLEYLFVDAYGLKLRGNMTTEGKRIQAQYEITGLRDLIATSGFASSLLAAQ